MKDFLLIIYMVAFSLYFGRANFLVWKFKKTSITQKSINRKDLRRVTKQLILLAFAIYLTLLLILNIDSLIDNSTQGEFSLIYPLFICLGGGILLPLVMLYSQLAMLRTMGLFITDD